MYKPMIQFTYATMALVFGIAAATPPAVAHEVCGCWHPHHHIASVWRRTIAAHPVLPHPVWTYRGWGPGVGFEALTGVRNDHVAVYNHPYYYGGGPYGNCMGSHLVFDQWGNVFGLQAVYIC